jgi:hypothetical protein
VLESDPAPFAAEWTRCAPWIEAALEYSRGTHLIEDVRAMVEAGRAHFHPFARCAVVTEFLVYPRLKALHFWLCGGSLEALVEVEPRIAAWGVLQGCTRFTTAGREGWRRALRANGYEPAWHVCLRDLN